MIVMKFGGTSVGSSQAIRQVAGIVKSHMKREPVVVVSAVGGVTDLLLQAGKEASQGGDPLSLSGRIEERHAPILRELGVGKGEVGGFFEAILEVLKGISLLREFTPRTSDYLLSFGERMSARIVASCFRGVGMRSLAVDAWDAGFLTTSEHGAARPLPEASGLMKKWWKKLFASGTARPGRTGGGAGAGIVPVVTGFIGKDRSGEITTLGRGGSDFSASLLGAALVAEEIQIWTDVSGIMTADPRLVRGARALSVISFPEAAELAFFGGKILHPKTIEPAVRDRIPVVVKNTFSPRDPGTTILAEVPVSQAGEGGRGRRVRGSRGGGASGQRETPGLWPVKAVTCKKGITVVNVYSTRMLDAHGFLAQVFEIFHRHEISIDVIATSEVNISLTLDDARGLAEAIHELSRIATVTVEGGRSIICLVGDGIKSTRGVAGKVFAVLAGEGINVEMISQGASQINLSCVVNERETAKAVRSLHRAFFE